MASIKNMGNKFYVYYYHPYLKTPDGKKRQVYEDFHDEEKALKRKLDIEIKVKSGYFTVPSKMTVEDYFNTKFVPLYSAVKWKFKTWDTNMTYWKKDILPYFGQMAISRVTPTDIERFINLMREKKVRNKTGTPEDELPFLSETTIRYVYTLIQCFFNKAVKWDDIEKSPVKSEKPGTSNTKREFWQPESFDDALDSIQDELLRLAIHMAFRCTLRIGEVCALEWDSIDFESCTVSIDKTLQRVTLDAMNRIAPKEIYHTFPSFKEGSKSRLILTTPKSDFGVRVSTMSEQLCAELKQRKLKVTLDKARHGKRYNDNNLVFCFDDGRPIEPGRLSRKFAKWQAQHGIGEIGSVDFHSIRISSTSLMLAASGGDIKSVQKVLRDKSAGISSDNLKCNVYQQCSCCKIRQPLQALHPLHRKQSFGNM